MEANNVKVFSFYFQNLNTELKNLVSINSYGSALWKWCTDFQLVHKSADVSKNMQTWEVIGKIFQNFSWCTTTDTAEPNFTFLAYTDTEI